MKFGWTRPGTSCASIGAFRRCLNDQNASCAPNFNFAVFVFRQKLPMVFLHYVNRLRGNPRSTPRLLAGRAVGVCDETSKGLRQLAEASSCRGRGKLAASAPG